jgi:hypothetical protein
MSRDSYVGIATGWTAGVQFLAEARDFYFLHVVQTDSGVHPTSYPMGTGGSFLGGIKLLGREADHSPPSNAEVRKGGAVPPLYHIFSRPGA